MQQTSGATPPSPVAASPAPAPFGPSLAPLLSLLSHVALETCQSLEAGERERGGEEEEEQGDAQRSQQRRQRQSQEAPIDPTLVAQRVMQESVEWPRTNPRFHKLHFVSQGAALDSDSQRAQLERELENERERVQRQLQHLIDPASHPLPVDSAPSGDETLSGLQSDGSATIRPYSPLRDDSLDTLLARLSNPSLSSLDRRRALRALIRDGDPGALDDVLGWTSWSAALEGITQACCAYAEHEARKAAGANASANVKPSPSSVAASARKSRPSASAAAPSFARAALSPRFSSRFSSSASSPPSGDPDDSLEAWLLSVCALDVLDQLFGSCEGGGQSGEMTLSLVRLARGLVTLASSFNATHSLQLLSPLPAPNTSASSLHPALRTSREVRVYSLLLQSSRSLTRALHALPDLWVHFPDELFASVVSSVRDLLTHALQCEGRLGWTILTMPDSRLSWLRRWLAQSPARRAWHAKECAAATIAWKHVCEGVAAFLLQPSSSSAPASGASPAAPSDLLALSPAELDALHLASCTSFVVEHVCSGVERLPMPPPSFASPTSSGTVATTAAPSSLSPSPPRHRRGKRSNVAPQPQVAQNAASRAQEDSSFLPSPSRAALASLAVRVLAHSASTPVARPASPLAQRVRLSTLSSLQHACSMLFPELDNSARSEHLQLILASVEQARTGVTCPQRDLFASMLASPSSAGSAAPRSLGKSRSQREMRLSPPTSSPPSASSSIKKRRATANAAEQQASAKEATPSPPPEQPSFTTLQQSALTGIVGVCLAMARLHPEARGAMLRLRVSVGGANKSPLPSSPSSAVTSPVPSPRASPTTPVSSASSSPSPPLSLLQLLCRWLGFDSAERGFEFRHEELPLEDCGPNDGSARPSPMALPSVLQSMMRELLYESFRAMSPFADEERLQLLPPLRALADRVQHQLSTLPSAAVATASPPPSSDPLGDDLAPPHVQCEELTQWMDLCMHWACSALLLDVLGESHPTVLASCCARFVQLLRLGRVHAQVFCAPGCAACEHECAFDSTAADPPSILLTSLHSQLRVMACSPSALLALLRVGLGHLLLDRLGAWLSDERSGSGAAFGADGWNECVAMQLAEEENSDEGPAAPATVPAAAWHLRMLRTLLGNSHALRVLDSEAELLSAPSVDTSALPLHPLPPLFLLLSRLVHSWLLLLDFDREDSASAVPPPSLLPLALPLRFPLLLFSSSGAASASVPLEWIQPSPVVACAIDAQEVALRLICGLLESDAGAAYAAAMDRWWELRVQVEDGAAAEIEDQTSAWERRLMHLLAAKSTETVS